MCLCLCLCQLKWKNGNQRYRKSSLLFLCSYLFIFIFINIFTSVCQKFCPQRGGGGVCMVGMVGGQHGWQQAVCMAGACLAGGHAWQEKRQ